MIDPKTAQAIEARAQATNKELDQALQAFQARVEARLEAKMQARLDQQEALTLAMHARASESVAFLEGQLQRAAHATRSARYEATRQALLDALKHPELVALIKEALQRHD